MLDASRLFATAKSALRRLGLLPAAKRLAARLIASADRWRATRPVAYCLRILQEKATYGQLAEVHDLPPIYHYWSNTHLLPKAREFGFSGPDEFFANHLERSLAAERSSRFLSIGAGNCDTELRVAALLRNRGHADFVIECLDLNPAMLRRGREAALRMGLDRHLSPVPGDFNRWVPNGHYDAVMANQALHHVLELEHLFASVGRAIDPDGRFVISDMIGRNGHLRWPEALAIVREFWKELPEGYRHNRLLGRHEDTFLDWDCSAYGFEGIRAQDILPLLVERFHFELFLPFANVIDPFIDRAFGPNFNPERPWDRDFIDRVHARDEAEMRAGRIKPTHAFAVLRTQIPQRSQWPDDFSPAFSVRCAYASPAQ